MLENSLLWKAHVQDAVIKDGSAGNKVVFADSSSFARFYCMRTPFYLACWILPCYLGSQLLDFLPR